MTLKQFILYTLAITLLTMITGFLCFEMGYRLGVIQGRIDVMVEKNSGLSGQAALSGQASVR